MITIEQDEKVKAKVRGGKLSEILILGQHRFPHEEDGSWAPVPAQIQYSDGDYDEIMVTGYRVHKARRLNKTQVKDLNRGLGRARAMEQAQVQAQIRELELDPATIEPAPSELPDEVTDLDLVTAVEFELVK